MSKNVKLIEVPSELGAGTRGASMGIDSLKIAALDYMSNFFVQFPTVKVETENKILHDPIDTPFAKRIKGIVSVTERVAKTVHETIKGGFFPLVLSGDHSNSIGTIAGIKSARPKSKIGVIWIDAHADLHSPYTTPSGNVHGMPLAASIADDNKKFAINELDEPTLSSWEKLKKLQTISPKILAEDIVFISLRDFEKQEKHLIDHYGIKVFTTSQVRTNGIESTVRSIFRYLNDCDEIYISFDVDSLDASISKGTGTPVKNGLKEREAEDLITKLMTNRKIICFEITEVNPTLDKENLMSEIAFNIIQRSVNALLMH
jgi:arginase